MKAARIVILVDESGSISEQDMVRERSAAEVIAKSELSGESTIAVVGFASDNGAASPVDVVCRPTKVAGAAERDQLTKCIGNLRKRAPGKGEGTDHAAALQQALSFLTGGAPADGPKLIFLLTDGDLDVRGSTRYGVDKSGQQRNDAAHEIIRQELVKAKAAGVQVWPLGFGSVQKPALDEFAAGGHQGDCGPTVPGPSTTVVRDSADVTKALFKSFATGRCNGTGPVENTDLGSGDNVEIPVIIPPIATNGSIIVVKHDPRIAVEYLDPDGKAAPKAGTNDSGSFEVSGESSAVEVLRIVDPKPGTWTVRVTSLPDIPPQTVLTTVTWQGAAQITLVVDPPSPAAGEPVTLSLRVVLRGGRPVTEPDMLRGLDFALELEDDTTPRAVPLSDSGQDPDTAADGTYTGRLTIPTDAERATFRGRVTGLGISAADAVAVVEVSEGSPTLLATATLPTIASRVAPGEEVDATVAVSNNSGARQEIRLQVTADNGAVVTIPAEDAVRSVDPGSSSFDFPLAFGEDTRLGMTTGVVRVVDAGGRVLHEKPFTVEVALPFPWLRWIIVGLLAISLLSLGAFLFARRRAQEVEGLTVQAIRSGNRVGLSTEARKAKSFRFVVDTSTPVPRLDLAQPGDPSAYVLTRSQAGLRLRTPYGEVLSAHLGQEVEVGEGLTIVVTDDSAYAEPVAAGYGADYSTDYGTPPASGTDYGTGPTQTMRDPYE
ncbi:VWA domain-containing protein [Actinokineospora sp. 24-640]